MVRRAHQRLLDVLKAVDPASPSWTSWPSDQNSRLLVRRMAQETAMHWVDVQGASVGVTSVDAELTIDGIDEFLMMLAGDWRDDAQPGSIGTTKVAAGNRSWQIVMSPDRITVNDDGSDPDARVAGAPSDLLLWSWADHRTLRCR